MGRGQLMPDPDQATGTPDQAAEAQIAVDSGTTTLGKTPYNVTHHHTAGPDQAVLVPLWLSTVRLLQQRMPGGPD